MPPTDPPAPPEPEETRASKEAAPPIVEVGPLPSPERPSGGRLAALALILLALLAVGHLSGLTEHVTRESLRALMERLGILGLLLFVGVFTLGEFVHVPGIVFVLAALLAYGRVYGALAAYLGGLVSLTLSFLFVRRVGGQALSNVKRGLLGRILAHLEAHPVLTVAALRVVFFLTPALNYALAMTRVRTRDFILGSAIGLLLPIVAVALAFEWVLDYFG